MCKPSASVQVAFGPGVMPSTSLKVYGAAKEENVGNRSASVPKSSDNGETLLSLPSAANEDGNDACSADPMETSAQIVKKEYRERWVRKGCHEDPPLPSLPSLSVSLSHPLGV